MGKPIRVLHALAGLNRGGIETWLVNVLHRIDREKYHFDFLVQTDRKCPYDDEVLSLGSQVIPCLSADRPWVYAQRFKHAVKQYGPYDVLHSHNYLFSGFDLFLAQRSNIPLRIGHIYPTVDWKARGRGIGIVVCIKN